MKDGIAVLEVLFYVNFVARYCMDVRLNRNDFELMAPAGSRESLAAALNAGADAVYFGVEHLNMRAHSAATFTIDDLKDVATMCAERDVKSYLTLNTVIYDDDVDLMHRIVDAAYRAGITAIIASDMAVMSYCHGVGMDVHLSTQLNISNIEALKFYARLADVVVLARELNLEQVANISRAIEEQNICGPNGRKVRIEMFCHGALCMAVSGKCYLSLDNMNSSANRGRCMQLCRRSYTVTDNETGTQLCVEGKNIMSPKDLKTIGFLDRMIQAGVRVFKIEGRARGPEYVHAVTTCYREAIESVVNGTFTEQKKKLWNDRLRSVFNRGFWDGYYLGRKMGEWAESYGSVATERKIYAGKVTNYFSRIGVGEFKIEATELNKGDRLLVTGPTTGALWMDLVDLRNDEGASIETARKGSLVSFEVPMKVRAGDKLFRIEKTCNNIVDINA